jgi:16S rRNA (guanine527-N7)-methyltransferase
VKFIINNDIFSADLSLLDIKLTKEQFNQFNEYYNLLVEWNSYVNLTAITDYVEVLKKHFVDSLSLVKLNLDLTGKTLVDVGTGAGFPGIPLKIAFPDLQITLIDSLQKRVKFLNNIKDHLGLDQVTVLHGRAEDYSQTNFLREQFDICVSRAVANLSTLSEYCIPYVKVGGYFISYKSDKIADEINGAQKAINELGGQVKKQISFYLPNSEINRTLLLIEKINNTPDKYPRKAGLPAKKPL